MWKDYSLGYIRNNRSASRSVRFSAFLSALLLSLLCGLFYNAWKYEVERIVLEEGGWQSRIIGEFESEEIEAVRNYANVKEAVVTDQGIEICFDDMGSVFSDMPRIAEMVGAPPENVIYHYGLLAMYLIRDSKDTAPRLVFPLFLLIMALASFSLIVIIHNAFAVSMNARIHQFGIFSSIGATPKQIRRCLLQEAVLLCTVPILLGDLLGIAGSLGVIQLLNGLLGNDIPGRHKSVPGYHPLVLLLTLLVTVMTIWISAWFPARKLSRLTPLEAIRNTEELQLKRRKNFYFLKLLFGVEGELAGNALKAQRKALRTASLSLILAFLAFTIMQCFFTLSGISTRETYFERYQGVWDIMITIKDTEMDDLEETGAIQGLTGLKSAIVYQKAKAKRLITAEEMSDDMQSFGGFSHASEALVTQTDDGWLVNAPIIILDDHSFLAYCEQIGAPPQLTGAVILNQIRDVTDPDFRHPNFMPYVKMSGTEENAVSILRKSGEEERSAKIPVLFYTEKVPALREEYASIDYYELVHFIPVSLWKEMKEQIGGTEEDSYLCIRARENVTLNELHMLQEKVAALFSGKYTIECENRIQEYETNNKQIRGIMAIFGGFCVLLAVIGIGNVFFNTSGFVRQRKREFARYMSIGMTPDQLRKMFAVEALVLALRPILTALPLTVLAVWYMLEMSYLEAGEFLAQAPMIPVIAFMITVLGSVAFAYYLAWQNVRRISLAEVLKDDTMM